VFSKFVERLSTLFAEFGVEQHHCGYLRKECNFTLIFSAAQGMGGKTSKIQLLKTN